MAFKKGKGVGTLARMNGKDREREGGREREGEGGGGGKKRIFIGCEAQ